MGKIISVFLIILAIAAAGYFIVKHPIKSVSVFTPVATSSGQNVKKLADLGVFADLGGALPRVLAFDPDGVLFASLTANGKVVALPDNDGNGQTDRIIEILTSLNNPHGLAFDGGKLYVAESNKVVRYAYDPVNFKASSPETLFTLPSGAGHFTRTIKIYGNKLYTTVGSSCNVCIEAENFRAKMLISDLDGKNLRVFAKGLRNTVFFTFDPSAGSGQVKIWGNDMGRDLLGDNLPPDELNIIQNGKDYGWPFCYGDKIRDSKFKPGEEGQYCNTTEAAKFEYPAHVAPLGIVFDKGNLIVSFHGSWNSSVPVGYKVVKLTLLAGKVLKSEDYITGFISGREVLGRPVDLIFDKAGNLYISDDKAGLIYILSKKS